MSSSLKTLCMRLPASPSSVVRCCPKAAFTTVARPSSRTQQQQQQAFSLPKTFAGRANRNLPTSTSTARSPAEAVRFYSSASSAQQPQQPTLDWDSFFKLRLRRRRIQLLFSVTTGFIGGAAGAIVLAEGVAEPLIAQIPLDPFVTLGLMTTACAGLGWLIGPTVGNQVFYIINRRFKAQMMQKESEFFARVKKHRVDPTNSSIGNPVPDFYGEKIQSVSGYRRWLKDQRAFNKKKTASFV